MSEQLIAFQISLIIHTCSCDSGTLAGVISCIMETFSSCGFDIQCFIGHAGGLNTAGRFNPADLRLREFEIGAIASLRRLRSITDTIFFGPMPVLNTIIANAKKV